MNGKRVIALLLVVLLAVTSLFATAQAESTTPTTLCTAIKFLDNPYHIDWIAGGEMFAESVGLKDYLVNQACQGSSEKQVNDIKALVAKTNGNVVFNIDPNQSPDVVPIVKALEDAGVFFVTWWNKPDDMKVADYDHWVAHITFDGVSASHFISTALFNTFKTPGKGKILAIQGQLANSAFIERWEGLQNALKEFPGVEMVAYGCAEWDRQKAFEMVTNMLVSHRDIDGVWCANDSMAMGALEALRAAGLAGKVKVCGVDGTEEMIRAIAAGEAAATAAPDAKWQGGLGLSMAYAAKEGKLDVAAIPAEKRQFYATMVNIDASNANAWIKDVIEGTPVYDWNSYFDRFLKTIK